MKLDLRRPTLVLAGAWNPAIFKPAWIGLHVFGIPAGAEFTVIGVQIVDGGEQKLAFYINNVGISVSPNRLEIFAVDPGAFDDIENATAKILELLPHTPISAYGINFQFVEEKPSSDLMARIRGHDELEKRFDVAKENISSTINLEPKVQLNLQRKKSDSSLIFSFNFHRSGVEIRNSSIRGEVQMRLAQALSIMKDVYGLSKYEVLTPEFNSSPGGQE
jgi:hypothetical protein